MEITVTACVNIPDDKATATEIQSWLEYNLHVFCSLSCENPLIDEELEATSVSWF